MGFTLVVVVVLYLMAAGTQGLAAQVVVGKVVLVIKL
jgi:hypothetical protein